MKSLLQASIGFLFIILCTQLAVAQVEVKTRFEACVGLSTGVTEEKACYILNLVTGEKEWEITLASGVNLNSAVMGFGASASTMLVSTVTFPRGKASTEQDAVAFARLQVPGAVQLPANKPVIVKLYAPIVQSSIEPSKVTIRASPLTKAYPRESKQVYDCVCAAPDLKKFYHPPTKVILP